MGSVFAFSLIGPSGAPAQAEMGFFSSLREMFSAKPLRPKRVVPRQPVIAIPRLSFAYAHQAGRHKRYRYSHQTPYGFYYHPYRHGFAAAKLTRPRPKRRTFGGRRQEFRFNPNGRVRRMF
jgi:hypothetical protein